MNSILTRFRAFCVSSFPIVAFALVVSNFITSCAISRSSHPQYLYKTVVFTNVVSSVVTNYLSSPSSLGVSLSSSDNPQSQTQPQPQTPPTYPVNYKYFVVGDSPMIYMNGVYYGEGQVCSKGIVIRIFPDCVYLHNGSVLENKSHPREDTSFPKRESSIKLPKIGMSK